MTDFHWILLGGKLVQSVTSVTLVNNTAKTVDTTVPAGKRWFLINIELSNIDNVTRAISVLKYKEAAKTNLIKTYDGGNLAASGLQNYPRTHKTDGTENLSFPDVKSLIVDILDAGNTISVTWAAGGASTGGTDADGLVIEYLEVDV